MKIVSANRYFQKKTKENEIVLKETRKRRKQQWMTQMNNNKDKVIVPLSHSRINPLARCSYVQLKITRNKKKRRRKIVPRSALSSYFCWRTRDHCCRYLFMSRLVCRSDKIAFTRQQCRFRRNQDQLGTHTFQCLQQTSLFVQGNTTARNLI